MSLLNFIDSSSIEQMKEQRATSLDLKNQEIDPLIKNFIDKGMTKEQAKAEAEMQLFVPKHLPKITLKTENVNIGKGIQISFFVFQEEYEQIEKKFKIIKQFDELRISSASTKEFITQIIK